MNQTPVLPARLDWPSVVGNFILNFGTLDYLIYTVLHVLLPPEEYERVRPWHLKDRVSRIAQHFRDQNDSGAKNAAFDRWVERLEPVRELRNHIAHGYLAFTLDPETKSLHAGIKTPKDWNLVGVPEVRKVTIDDLLECSRTLDELTSEMEDLAGFKVTHETLPAEVDGG